jgi:eukaryotic-like serine/threonine-protein kinase
LQYADAEPLLVDGYGGMKQREAQIPADDTQYLTEALERLVQLYDGWGKKAQADEWRKRLDVHKKGIEELEHRNQESEKKPN